MQKITPFLWFNDNAEEAVNFYLSLFKEAQKSQRAMQALMQMRKIIIADLQNA